MIEIKIDGYEGRIGGLVTFDMTATGIVVRLHGPLADAVKAMTEEVKSK